MQSALTSGSGLIVRPASPRCCSSDPRRSPPRHRRPILADNPSTRVLSHIQASGVIACLRAPSPSLALCCARAALDGGITVLEIVLSTPGVFDVIRQLVLERPQTSIGVGTVLRAVDAEAAIDAGVKFLMSPVLVKEVLCHSRVRDGEVLYIPGAMTPTEIVAAHDAGARVVKVYPVSALGGVKYLSALRKPFAHIPMVASQGIRAESVGEYIAAGAVGVVLSDAVFQREAVERGEFDAVSRQAGLVAAMGFEAVSEAGSKYTED